MPWKLDEDRPIYLQLMERIQLDIISEKYAVGDKLPSVRDLALEAGVNPNTMQKALSELEQTGLVLARRTSGRFVTDDPVLIKEVKRTIAKNEIKNFLKQMEHLGFSPEETVEILSTITKEEK